MIILATAAALAYFAISFWLFWGAGRLSVTRNSHCPFVSVVVAARNEEHNIERCLRHLLAQTYPAELFEIIAVNDRSEDETGSCIRRLSDLHPSIKPLDIIQLNHAVSGKKNALANGIASAKGEIILTTDADCVVPPDWIRRTVELFDEKTGMVIGPAPFIPGDAIFNKIMRVDNIWSALISAGGSGWNIGITCTGRNLAYRRKAYEDVHGFKKVQHSISGDDDLLLHLISQKTDWRIRYNLLHDMSIFSEAPASIPEFVRQRRRHVSAARYYNRGIKLGFFVGHAANVSLFLLPIAALGSPNLLPLVALLASKFCVDWLLVYLFARKTGRTGDVSNIIFWQFFNLINQTIISPSGLLGKIRWR